jgi:predicted negative regulator of RcsB-dependent stress response
MKTNTQSGFAHLGLLLVVLVLAAVAFAGYRVWQTKEDVAPVTATVVSDTVPSAIKSKADLIQTSKVLDQADDELDASLNGAALDSDIDSLL